MKCKSQFLKHFALIVNDFLLLSKNVKYNSLRHNRNDTQLFFKNLKREDLDPICLKRKWRKEKKKSLNGSKNLTVGTAVDADWDF